jgi:hypothetical protein
MHAKGDFNAGIAAAIDRCLKVEGGNGWNDDAPNACLKSAPCDRIAIGVIFGGVKMAMSVDQHWMLQSGLHEVFQNTRYRFRNRGMDSVLYRQPHSPGFFDKHGPMIKHDFLRQDVQAEVGKDMDEGG